MLKDANAVANIAVKDLEAARKFYGGTLGLEESGGMDGEVIEFRSGSSKINVYRSEYAGTNKATAMSFDVGDEIEEVVGDLRSKGIAFEHYPEMKDMKVEGDLHVAQGMKVAWFKDPDGNILNLYGT